MSTKFDAKIRSFLLDVVEESSETDLREALLGLAVVSRENELRNIFKAIAAYKPDAA